MKTQDTIKLFALSYVLILSGCVVRTYPLTKDRIDQDLTAGNRGYIKGEVPASGQVYKRPAKRTIQAVEIELHSPIRFEKAPRQKAAGGTEAPRTEDKELWGNRGYITESYSPKIEEPSERIAKQEISVEKYSVKKGDTLQKISQKFYGTSKEWVKIYEANKSTLSGPNKIYPGQVINIPVAPLKETKENLK